MTYLEILSSIQRHTNTQNTTTSSYPIDAKTLDINNAFNRYFLLAASAEGTWEVDDTNQTDYPIIYSNLVANQQDYSFLVDENGNQIMDIYRVEIKDTSGNGKELYPIDRAELQGIALTEFMSTSGTPMYYDKTANGLFLYPAPSYNSTNGITIYINRTPTYFTTSDTTKKAGIPWVFHEYLALRPSYYYCLDKGLPQADRLLRDLLEMEDKIQDYYSHRTKDEKQQLRTVHRSSR